ncbi:peptidoglycan D,D-transpeptidase FtsI family protein [Thermophilibacter provencensis]|uniref:Penicillin-binding protein 2 n=1 Tax=Thermophilibacter provencensis TaxID=1852386 RepID=A0ABT7V457_9ACTN|nr:penicillin-binding protein 2 [Thermophilibacter provencensis]MDM8271378.1 penicillin-binding protein 2 [Thermophilibacter provencensis]
MRRSYPEASYDEASRARYHVRASRPGGSGSGGSEKGLSVTRRLFMGLFGIVAARLAWLQVVDAGNLSSKAELQRTNVATLHAKRGTIYDRNGNILAMSEECKTIYANPEAVSDPSGVADVLVELLGGEKDTYMDLLTMDGTFVYIERQVDQGVADELKSRLAEAELSGIYYLPDMKRVYPYGKVGAQVIGYVGTDGTGLSGLEYYYNDILTGTDGEMLMETGLDGTPIAGGASQVTEAKDGMDLVLSLDIDLQESCENIISQAVQTYNSDSGSVMVTDPLTGEIIAACSTPLPDFSDLDSTSLNLRLVSDSYEPGSVFKVLTTSIGLDLGLYTKDTVYNVPAFYKVGNDYVSDDDGRDYALDMSVEYMLVHSSNPAMSKLVLEVIGPERFSEGVDRYGIGHLTGIDFPGEVEGIVKTLEEYDGSTAGSMAFGQGLAIPMVQIVRAFGAVANDGVPMTPHFLVSKGGEDVEWPAGERIISAETANEETVMMRGVMREGTGKNGQVEGYDFAGKTGTGEQASEEGGYAAFHYVASLCGFANADNPELLVYAGLNGTAYLALASSAHVFHDVAAQATTIMGVKPVS